MSSADHGMRSFRDLVAWQQAMSLVEEVYRATVSFPAHEQYGLCNQLRRAAVSVPSNIAEGRCRESMKEFHHFLGLAYASLAEVQTQIEIAERLQYIPLPAATQLQSQSNELARVINGLKRSVVRRLKKKP